MKKLLDFTIPFKGLGLGAHSFDFQVDQKFFEFFNYSELESGNLRVDLILDRQISHMSLDFHFHGTVRTVCDRCLDEMDYPLDFKESLVIKLGDEIPDARHIGEDVPVISHHETEINVAQFVFEFIVLALPPRKVHPDDADGNPTCDPEMLEKLDEYLAPDSPEGETDPRWDALKNAWKNN